MGIVGGFEWEHSGHRNGSACDIINQRELPSAWISGISVSQTVKGWGRPIGRGGSGSVGLRDPRMWLTEKLILWLILKIKNETGRWKWKTTEGEIEGFLFLTSVFLLCACFLFLPKTWL